MDSTSPENKSGPGGSGAFNTTHWSVVFQACGESPEALAALASLYKAYRYPLYVHVRRLGWGPEDADDFTQQFFVRLIERKDVHRADPARGRFRSFLLTSLKHFLADEWDKLRAQKRGGGQSVISWDGLNPEELYRMEPADSLSPDLAYDKSWAGLLLKRVVEQVRAEWEAERDGHKFDLLMNPSFGDGQAGSYARIGEVLNMTEIAVKTAVHRLRKAIERKLREEVSRTVSSPGEVDDEMRYLRSLLSS